MLKSVLQFASNGAATADEHIPDDRNLELIIKEENFFFLIHHEFEIVTSYRRVLRRDITCFVITIFYTF